jgi:fermentation-respiration switch protein FrsA (DUF1100 family)
MAIERRDVAFESCGATLRGFLYLPESATGPVPAVAMAPGLSGVKEQSIVRFAEFFATGGFAALAFDNINFGASGGEPRQEVDPALQKRGYSDAVTFLSLRPEIDRARIGIWGTSFSGGHVLVVAATDRRVKCVVAQVPSLSGTRNFLRRVRPDQRATALARLVADREARFRGEPPAMIPAVSAEEGTPCVMAGRAAYEYFTRTGEGAPNWRNEVTLRSVEYARGIETAAFLPFISPTPLLMIVAIEDELVPSDVALDEYRRARPPKKLILLPGGHFSPYGEEFALAGTAARDWFHLHLIEGGTPALNVGG